MDETLPDSSRSSQRAGSPPARPDDDTLPSAPRNAGGSAPTPSGGSNLTFKGKERDLSGAQLGEYQLVRKIAVGGMGEVYEGVQLKLDRRVAIKLLSEELSREQEFLARFEREAKSAAALNHPNVVQVYDYGCAEGQYYFVMELVDGTDLSVFVKEHGKLSVPDALNYFEQAVNALRFAARLAIIHRDVKPANLMLTREGTVKVSDLGLAKKLTDDSDVTMTGVGMGSPHFLAPEQADDAAHVDHRADIYALGVTLLYLLTGKRPFEGASNFSVVLAHANKPLPSGVELGTALPDEIERFIRRMTAKRPEARYQDYDELLADLQLVKAGHRPSVNWFQVIREPRNLQRLAIGAVVLLIAALAAPLMLPDGPLTRTMTKVSTDDPGVAVNNGDFQPPAHPDDRDTRPRYSGEGPGGMKSKGPGGIHLPWPPPPQKSPNPLKDAPAAEMLAEADRYAMENKDDLTGIVERYWQVAERARGTPLGQEAQRKSDNAFITHQVKSHALIEELTAKMDALVQQNRPQEAFEVWRAFPQAWRTRETDEEILALLSRSLPRNFQPRD